MRWSPARQRTSWEVCLGTGGFPWRTQKEALDEGVDLVVATPGRLGEHIKAGTLKLHQCQAIVMDEADVLLGDAYAFSAQVRPCSATYLPNLCMALLAQSSTLQWHSRWTSANAPSDPWTLFMPGHVWKDSS